jgi:hypothetical protein
MKYFHKLSEAAARHVGYADAHIFLIPLIRNTLRINLHGSQITSDNLEIAAIEPLSEEAFRWAITSMCQYQATPPKPSGVGAGNTLETELSLLKDYNDHHTFPTTPTDTKQQYINSSGTPSTWCLLNSVIGFYLFMYIRNIKIISIYLL